MSIKTWKKEFYPKKPTKRMTTVEAIEHSLLKWIGLLHSNLEKHELISWGHSICDVDCCDEDGEFRLGQTSCSLCVKFLDNNKGCTNCPLYQSLGRECGDGTVLAPYTDWMNNHDALPMIHALEKTLKDVKAGRV